MSAQVFTSVFAEELRRYLAFKQDMGCYGSSRIWYLRSFDAYCTEHGVTCFDQPTVEGWVISKKASQLGSPPSWMSYIRDFGRWMRTHGNPEAYVLAESWRAGFAHSRPYLLSRDEIKLFFQSAAELKTTSPWKWQSVAFFGLMHSCGLRTCETRRLRPQDVDLEKAGIDVLWSKGNRSRRLPITAEIIDILAECDRTSRKIFGQQRPRFFVSSTPAPVAPASIGVMFNRIWDHAGLPRAIDGIQPHPYSFRHHFAYANIERWMAEGTDVNAMLPYLSRYMGHASLDSTYYYIHTSPDFMDGYAALTRDGQGVFPEVGFQ
ncbi:tyrosine-type recombinase/integrase [Arthrobacter sp. STN4]|uniref:tyrosine-type recombinase/integrase n=1 Tax=Arthrobacter sp. STN4 TaxID=2923276 RepID=UPI00211A3200|nr:tyrosine-type recombinase/integrase [Arthrobacter sp. STN4]MCQ9164196.1 tyrosine-type recombinase/integrase [Arthrobacter sp. STN4]